jgi:predicted TIM-barrel fold metal-dependent hydrolase
MSINGHLVIDAVTHAFNIRKENAKGRYALLQNEANFQLQWNLIPDPYRLPRTRYFQKYDSETLESALFVESDTDVAFYHSIPAWGVYHEYSPIHVGMEIRARYPHRMFCYGAVSPLEGQKALDDLEQQAAEWDIKGLKLYPVDFIDGELKSFLMSDEKVAYPIFERCRALGIKTVAIHKAQPLGGAPMDPFRPGDVDYAALDFPDLNFEIVHGGFAFLEETATQVRRFRNVYVNLEANTLLILRQPRTFARMLGELLREGGPTKLFWGTGCMVSHPQPLLDAFADFAFPEDMVEGENFPVLTDEIKGQILGLNFARLHGLDVDELRGKIEGDELTERKRNGQPEPWSKLPERGDPAYEVAATAGQGS